MKTKTERFWNLVDIRGPDECWPWKGGRSGKDRAYGTFDGRAAHRFALFGEEEWKRQEHALHSCDFGLCCNPSHLFAGDRYDNIGDAVQKGRMNPRVGEKHGNAKLTDEKVLRAKELRSQGWDYYELASEFGVGQSTIRMAVLGITWKHLK